MGLIKLVVVSEGPNLRNISCRTRDPLLIKLRQVLFHFTIREIISWIYRISDHFYSKRTLWGRRSLLALVGATFPGIFKGNQGGWVGKGYLPLWL